MQIIRNLLQHGQHVDQKQYQENYNITIILEIIKLKKIQIKLNQQLESKIIYELLKLKIRKFKANNAIDQELVQMLEKDIIQFRPNVKW